MKVPALNLTDFYKADHRRQYPKNTQFVYSNFTPRISRIPGVEGVIVFGIQPFLKERIVDAFNKTFFQVEKNIAVGKYKRRMDTALGKDAIEMTHIEELWDLGYLPIHIKALEEGTLCPLKVPVLTITNTLPEFGWVTNFLETLLSASLWYPITSATTAFEYRKVFEKAARETSDEAWFVDWQGHDFSMRGQTCIEAAAISGAAHLTSFTGTDTIPALDFLEEFYEVDAEKELIGGSVYATEHAVMCLGGKETEPETYARLITEIYPKGIVSIVSDTWDFFHTVNVTVRALKDKIMAREGKVVIRPDSGDPVTILCGDMNAVPGSPEFKGTIELLWDIFGGITNSKGFKQLDPHIGAIYGDSITLDRANRIIAGLREKGFASTNIVFGIGSYTYQYVTRDTFGFAMKATHGIIDGKSFEIFKDPLTDGGVKKSAKGYLKVDKDVSGKIVLQECVTKEQEKEGLLKTVFLDGHMMNTTTLVKIRAKIKESL